MIFILTYSNYYESKYELNKNSVLENKTFNTTIVCKIFIKRSI